jgi:hypothetical protein
VLLDTGVRRYAAYGTRITIVAILRAGQDETFEHLW